MQNLYKNEQLEFELIQVLMSRPELYAEFPLQEKFFSNPFYKKIAGFAIDKIQSTGHCSLVDLLELKDEISVSAFFKPFTFLGVETTFGYLSACQKLLDFYAQKELILLLGRDATPEEVKEKAEELIEEIQKTDIQDSSEVIRDYETYYLDLQERKRQSKAIGIETYWPKFNSQVGLTYQNFMIIGARPSVGKTAFAINLALEIINSGQKVLFVSCEMGKDEILSRFIALNSKIKISDLRFGKVNLDQHKAQFEKYKGTLKFAFKTQSSHEIIAAAEKINNLDVVIVDYLQLLNDSYRKGETENNRISRISRSLKSLSMKKKCAVIALAQLNRGSEKENREPRLSDLRDSGSIEQDADIVGLLHRKDRKDPETLLRIAKNRNGKIGDLWFDFNSEIGEFKETENIYLN